MNRSPESACCGKEHVTQNYVSREIKRHASWLLKKIPSGRHEKLFSAFHSQNFFCLWGGEGGVVKKFEAKIQSKFCSHIFLCNLVGSRMKQIASRYLENCRRRKIFRGTGTVKNQNRDNGR